MSLSVTAVDLLLSMLQQYPDEFTLLYVQTQFVLVVVQLHKKSVRLMVWMRIHPLKDKMELDFLMTSDLSQLNITTLAFLLASSGVTYSWRIRSFNLHFTLCLKTFYSLKINQLARCQLIL